jgi:hypothetical protein
MILTETIRTTDPQQFPTGVDTTQGQTKYQYERLSSLPALDDGVDLYLDASGVATNSQVRLISAETAAGFELFSMDRVSPTHYVDTIATKTNTGRLWNLLGCQEITRTPIPGTDPPIYTTQWFTWVVPYRIPQ